MSKSDSKRAKEQLDEIIGKNIRAERESRKLSRDELAELLELTTSHMGLIERGERGATAVTMSKLAKVFNMPVDNLFNALPEMSPQEKRDWGREPKAKQKKISSLITYLTEQELDFVIKVINALRTLNCSGLTETDPSDDE